MSLSPGPYSYNRFAGIPRGNTLSDSYRAIYEAKRAKKDYDGDGEIESGTDEYMGSRDKAIKKAMGKSAKEKDDKDCTCKEWVESLVDEGYDLSEYTWDDMERMFEENKIQYPKDIKSFTKSMQDPKVAAGREAAKKMGLKMNDDVKEHVCQYLMDEGYTNNEVSAEVLFNHMSDEWLNSVVNNIEELYKGKHGQSEKQYQDGRSPAAKMISGDSMRSGANYSYNATNTGPNPAGGSVRPQGQARMNNKDRAYLKMQKANMKRG